MLMLRVWSVAEPSHCVFRSRIRSIESGLSPGPGPGPAAGPGLCPGSGAESGSLGRLHLDRHTPDGEFSAGSVRLLCGNNRSC